jgi:hypothetical protein
MLECVALLGGGKAASSQAKCQRTSKGEVRIRYSDSERRGMLAQVKNTNNFTTDTLRKIIGKLKSTIKSAAPWCRLPLLFVNSLK